MQASFSSSIPQVDRRWPDLRVARISGGEGSARVTLRADNQARPVWLAAVFGDATGFPQCISEEQVFIILSRFVRAPRKVL